MNKLVFLGFGTLALAGVVLFSTNGCGARGKVAVDKAVSIVDKMLGELDVKRKEVSEKVAKLDKSIAGIREAKIETGVRKEMIQKKVDDQKASKVKADENLAKVRDLLKKAETESSDTIKTDSGKEIKKDDLTQYAKNLITEQTSITEKLASFEKAAAMLDRVVKSLERKEKEASEKLSDLKQTLEMIDNKKVAVKAMQDASSNIDGNQNLSESLADLEKEMEELDVAVETQLRLEDDKWAQTDEAAKMDEIKSILDADGEGTKLINEIDSLLK